MLEAWLERINSFVWGVPLIALIMCVGIYLTLRLKLLQVLHLPKALRCIFEKEKGAGGDVSAFGALCISLSATLGTGNIVGVATAVTAGGPGAIFWMLVAAFFGMATKYAEGVLAVKYRQKGKDGYIGGPFCYIEYGMGKKFKWLAKAFAFFGACAGALGIGTITQISGITAAARDFFDPAAKNIAFTLFGNSYTTAEAITGAIVTLLAGAVLIGGVKRIAAVSEFFIPLMSFIYIFICLTILLSNANQLIPAVGLIIRGAFNPKAVTGGVIGSFFTAMQTGIARGVFTNESGLGSAPIAAAAAKSSSCVKQGLVSMTGTFIDTMVMCTITGLCIMVTGTWQSTSLQGVQLTAQTFKQGINFLPDRVCEGLLALCLAFFAFSTIIGWNYYAKRCAEYFVNGNPTLLKAYTYFYIAAVGLGTYLPLAAVWSLADIFNALMALPNLIALLALSGVVVKETNRYFKG